MKKIFSFILIAISLNGLAQDFPITQSMASANTRLVVNGGLDAKKGLINGNYTDTTAANAGYIDFHHGAQIWTTSDKNLWLRDSVLNMWVRMAKFSDVGSSNLSWDAANHEVDIDGGGTSAVIPFASGGASGLVSTSLQTFAGIKTFSNDIQADNSVVWNAGTGSIMGTLANRSVGADNYGAIQFSNDLNANIVHFSILNPTGTRNINLPDASGTVALTSDLASAANIYNTDGTLTGARTLTMGSNNLSFSSLNGAQFSVTSSAFGMSGILSVQNSASTFRGISGGYDAGMQASPFQSFVYSQLNGQRSDITFDPDSIRINPGFGNLMIDSLDEDDGTHSLRWDEVSKKVTVSTSGGGSDTNFGNTNITFTGDRVHTVGNNDLELQGIKNYTLTVGTAYLLNANGTYEIVRSGTTRASINSSTTSFFSPDGAKSIELNNTQLYVNAPEYVFDNVPAGVGTKSLRYDPSSGEITFADTTTGGSAPSTDPELGNWIQYRFNSFTQLLTTGSGVYSIGAITLASGSMPAGWVRGYQMSPGTSASTNRANIYYDAGGNYAPIALADSQRFTASQPFRLRQLSNGTDRFEIVGGFLDDVTLSSGNVDAVGWRYVDTDSSGHLIFFTKSNSNLTERSTGVPIVANALYHVVVSVYLGVAYCWVRVNGGSWIQAPNITTNIPTGTARMTSFGNGINKLLGTGQVYMDIEDIAFGRYYK